MGILKWPWVYWNSSLACFTVIMYICKGLVCLVCCPGWWVCWRPHCPGTRHYICFQTHSIGPKGLNIGLQTIRIGPKGPDIGPMDKPKSPNKVPQDTLKRPRIPPIGPKVAYQLHNWPIMGLWTPELAQNGPLEPWIGPHPLNWPPNHKQKLPSQTSHLLFFVSANPLNTLKTDLWTPWIGP